jgi:tetratricopeptide (TPR) repeat protein
MPVVVGSGFFPFARGAHLGLVLLAALNLVACASTGAGPKAGADQIIEPPRDAPMAQATPPAPTQPAAPPQRASSANDEDALPAVELSRDIMFQVLAAELASQRGQLGAATSTYLALARNTRDPRMARRATELALADRSLERAMASARLWYELAPNSATANQTLEALLLANGNVTEVEPLVRRRLNAARSSNTLPQAYGQLQRSLQRSTDLAASLALLQRLAAQDLQVPEARLALAALATEAKDFERAALEMRAALALRPTDASLAVQTAAAIARSQAGAQGALVLLEDHLKAQPKATEARFAYARLLAQMERRPQAQAQMEQALSEDPDNPGILYNMAQLAYQLNQPDVAKRHLERYVDLPRTVQRDNMVAYLFLAQIEEQAKRLPQAIAWLEKINRGDTFLPALTQRAQLMARIGQLEAARELLRSTNVATNRERVQLTSAEAQLLREASRFADAFDVLDKALQRLPNDPDLLYDHGMSAEKMDRLDVMERSLKKLIELRPDHAHAHNALGYTFADRNIRLPEALALITRALELSPQDAHIIDSMGWVLYRQGQLAQAEQHLQRAFDLRPEAEIAAHLGEVLWQQGKTEQARAMWSRAQTLDPANQTLKETLQRFRISLQ